MKNLLSQFFLTINNAIVKINGMLPTLTPAEAQSLIADINALQNGLSDAIQTLQNVKPSLQRIVNGDNKHDGHNTAEASKAFAKLAAWDNGEAPFQVMIENTQAELAEQREKMAAEAAEHKRIVDERMAFIFRQTHPHEEIPF